MSKTTRDKPSAKAPRGTGAARIYEALRRRILNLELVPGADLDEKALASAFNISRTPLREALNRLASEQLVVISPNRGASVAPLNLTDFPAFIESLALAQSAVNAFAAMRRSDQDLVKTAQAFGEIIHQHLRARHLMRLKHAANSALGKRFTCRL